MEEFSDRIPFTCFTCEHCQTEIEASLDLIGQESECPACGARFIVPDMRDDDVVRFSARDDLAREHTLKSRTIRIELGDL